MYGISLVEYKKSEHVWYSAYAQPCKQALDSAHLEKEFVSLHTGHWAAYKNQEKCEKTYTCTTVPE